MRDEACDIREEERLKKTLISEKLCNRHDEEPYHCDTGRECSLQMRVVGCTMVDSAVDADAKYFFLRKNYPRCIKMSLSLRQSLADTDVVFVQGPKEGSEYRSIVGTVARKLEDS